MKLASKLPEDHGLGTLNHALVESPEKQHLVLGWVDCSKLTTVIDTGEVEPTVRITGIEVVVDPQDVYTCDRLMLQSRAKRTGQEPLPAVDPATGEISS